MASALDLNTVALSEDGEEIIILDQTLLPNETKYLRLKTAQEIREAIYKLRVRGAPALGVTGAYAYYVLSLQIKADNTDGFVAACRENLEYIGAARPTAVNLSWALGRMHALTLSLNDTCTTDEIRAALRKEADAIRTEDIAISRGIGEHGFGLLEKTGRGVGILTHCNAGTLATAKYGTALAPVYIALEQGWDPQKDLHVYCDETRPLLQGARLTAYEMQTAGVDTYLQCDNMASSTMQSGRIDIVFVGCDRVAANGDAANKIGTSGVAILAKHYGIPFYVCAPSSTIDLSIASGDEIPIEQRAPEEVTEMWYEKRMAPAGVKVVNPAFDVTDHSLITGIITEKGIACAPFREAFEKLGIH